VGVFSV
jgi:hypothetical protein